VRKYGFGCGIGGRVGAIVLIAGLIVGTGWAADGPGDDIKDWGPLNWEINTGAQFSQNRGSFSETDFYLEYLGDTLLWPSKEPTGPGLALKKSSFHLLLSLEMARAPSATASTDAVDFLTSRRSVTGSMGLEWRLARFGFEGGCFPIGLVGFSGLQTPVKELSAMNSGYVFWNSGLRMQYVPDDKESANPSSIFCFDVLWGDYHTIGSRRLTCEGWLNLTRRLNIGFRAISPRIIRNRKPDDSLEPSDFQLFAGYTASPQLFGDIAGKLIPRIFTEPDKEQTTPPTGGEKSGSSTTPANSGVEGSGAVSGTTPQ
jgi:hypothetical protein